jgi:hypothetical protein
MKRFSDRIPVSLEAEVVFNNARFDGKIENLSEEGIFIRIFPENGSADFQSGTVFKLYIELPTSETVSLDSRVVWSEVDAPGNGANNIGLEILEKPPLYDEYVKTTFTANSGIM